MRTLVVVAMLSGCAAAVRLAVGPVFDTHGAVGAQLSVTGAIGPSFETSQGRSFIGPAAGVEVGGRSVAPYAQLGFHLGVESMHLIADERWMVGAGARLSTLLALPPAAYVGRFSALVDFGHALKPGSCAPFLGMGVEGGVSFGGVPVSTSFGLMLVERWLCAPTMD